MARRRIEAFLVLVLAISIREAASTFQPISESHRSGASDLFRPVDGSFGSLEETYQALRTFEILGTEKPDMSPSTCQSVLEKLGLPLSTPKDTDYALKVNGILKCNVDDGVYEGLKSRLQGAVGDASALLDFHHLIGSLVLIKDQASNVGVHIGDAVRAFRSIKALSQSDGRWRYSSDNPVSSTYAAGIALEALAGVISLSPSVIDQSLVAKVKSDVLKLFDSIEKYDMYDGTYFFDEKVVDASEHQGPLSTTSSVVRGLTSFAAVTHGTLNVSGQRISWVSNN